MDGHWCYVLKDFGSKMLVIPCTSIKEDSPEATEYELDIRAKIRKYPIRSRMQLSDMRVVDLQRLDIRKRFCNVITDKKEIINIGWQKSNLEDIKQAVQNNDCIIINGTKEFIEKAREEIENNLLENKIIEIIDCYDIEDCKYGIKDILDKHDKILNTSGEKNKEEYITTIKVAN